MDRELRDWFKSLSVTPQRPASAGPPALSREGAEYLVQIATDGTLRAALDEIAANEPALAD